jgi:hypothetical protein
MGKKNGKVKDLVSYAAAAKHKRKTSPYNSNWQGTQARVRTSCLWPRFGLVMENRD